MALEIILKYAKEILLTNGGLSIFILIVYAAVHRHDHKISEKFFASHQCANFDILLEIKKKLDLDTDREKALELRRKRRELEEYAKMEDEILSHYWLVEMREFIRNSGYNVSDPTKYSFSLIDKAETLWSQRWDEKEKPLDKEAKLAIDKFRAYASTYMTHIATRIVYILIKNEDEKTRLQLIDLKLIEAIKHFNYIWDDILTISYGGNADEKFY
jgi:hypothetical protein